ncbi:MAG: hypothetical protein WAW07_00005 [Bacteroidales bacterium]
MRREIDIRFYRYYVPDGTGSVPYGTGRGRPIYVSTDIVSLTGQVPYLTARDDMGDIFFYRYCVPDGTEYVPDGTSYPMPGVP